MTNLTRSFRRATNKFQFVLELPVLYKTEQQYNEAILSLHEVGNAELSPEELAELNLGIVFMKRTRSKETTEELLNELDTSRRISCRTDHVMRISEVVRGAILLMKRRDYRAARNTLEPLHELLRSKDDHFLFAISSKLLAINYMILGDNRSSEQCFQYALTTFHRYRHRIFYTLTLNDYAVLKKRLCRYEESSSLLDRVLKLSTELDITSVRGSAYNNLGIINIKTGDWEAAQECFEKARSWSYVLVGGTAESGEAIKRSCDINVEHLMVIKRQFSLAEQRLQLLLSSYGDKFETMRMQALTHEFLGELYTETGQYGDAERHLRRCICLASGALSMSDVMTEAKCRLSNLYVYKGDYKKARDIAIECVKMTMKNGDLHERGVVLRVLGDVYSEWRDVKRARACYRTSIRILQTIRECYELMRSYIAYGAFLVKMDLSDAEIYLLEADVLCRKLQLDMFLVLLNIEFAKLEIKNKEFQRARTRLLMAEHLYDNLQGSDQVRVSSSLRAVGTGLVEGILDKSLEAAKELKAICRIYEDSHFPTEHTKPDLGYRIAQSVNAEFLFLIGRRGRGYHVSFTYNIPVKEAKEIVRRVDREMRKPLLGVTNDPKIVEVHTGHQMICVPTVMNAKYVLCAGVDQKKFVLPRQFEFLLTSAEVLQRLAHESTRSWTGEGFDLGGSSMAVTHPMGCFKDILTVSREMIELVRLAERASLSNETILLEGETGVGKELFARAIHDNSRRAGGPFVAVNAGGIPVNLLESQLFGHVRGAFTDAVRDRSGLIEDAKEGTVFLDEVGEMGAELQVKLLRLLENGEYRRLGENQIRIADVRVLSATNRDLLKEVSRGTFRRDLYYRLSTVKLQIPPLRFRERDIELLVRHFLKQCTLRNGELHRHFEIDVKAMEALVRYDWPGNVRELENEIRRIVSLIGDGHMIRFEMLSRSIKEYFRSKNRAEGPLGRNVESYERNLILDALNRNDWNRLRAAEELGVPRTTLLAKMRRLNVATR